LNLENQCVAEETAPFSPQAFQRLGNGVQNTPAHPVTLHKDALLRMTLMLETATAAE
jgi:hypothetical protein